MKRMTDTELIALRDKHLPHVNCRDILKPTEDGKTLDDVLSADDIATLEKYFHRFVASPDGCVRCGKIQGGDLVQQLLCEAQFTWGLFYGEGYCRNCGYPARAYHCDIGPIKHLPMILQYHPNELMLRSEEKFKQPVEAIEVVEDDR